MKIVGLSGGIASGKNFVAEIFAKNGAAVFDADREVHKLLEADKSTLQKIKKNFPSAILNGEIDRRILGRIVFADDKKLKILEKILHPKVKKKYAEFLKEVRKEKKKLVVLNIPLLLETKGYRCDKIIAIITSKAEQKKRFLERSKKQDPKNFASKKRELEKRFAQISAKQMTNAQRKKAADFVIKDLSKVQTVKWVKKLLEML